MEPQITDIATCFAARLPTEGVPTPDAVEAWRAALRYARQGGVIDPLVERIAEADPDPIVRNCCDALRR